MLTLDPIVFVIVNLRSWGYSEDEISSMKAIMESVDAQTQQRLAKLVALEDPEIIRAIIRKLPEIRDAVLHTNGKDPAEIIMEVSKTFDE